MERASSTKEIIVVTGAFTGIGLATVKLLAQQGYIVYGSVRTAGAAGQFADDPNLKPLLMDVTDESSIAQAVQTVQASLGRGGNVVGVINNAGIAVSGPLAYVPLDKAREQFEVNVIS